MSIKEDLLQVPGTDHLAYQVPPTTTTATGHLAYKHHVLPITLTY
jgi:hypothetical protein